MKIGVITVDGRNVGDVTLQYGYVADPFTPDLDGYEPEGRAEDPTRAAPLGGPSSDHKSASHHYHHGGGGAAPGGKTSTSPKANTPSSDLAIASHHHDDAARSEKKSPNADNTKKSPNAYTPKGETYQHDGQARPRREGSAETDQAIVDAARAHHLDPNTMRAIASIESSMNPSSNANNPGTQYKGLYQIGHDEWRRFGGGGNIYSARDNAMGAARMFEANRDQFRAHYHRDPTDAELYMMHQQGLGFYTRGAMTNIRGNHYPGMHGPQTHESFEAGWGRDLAQKKAGFAAAHPEAAEAVAPPPTSRLYVSPSADADKPFDPETMAP